MSGETVTERAARKGSRGGVVYLVGAGPGDPGLLTVRAARLLRRADVVVHDALVGEGVLDLIPPDVERIDVGKRCGGKRTSQERINEILISAARASKVVVRLKGGDPFVFGRGGEEAIALREAGVRFHVVPGVTAAVGVSAYAGIPLTHRDLASSVTFVAGHGKESPRGNVDWEALARLGGTLVVYMGTRQLAEIAATLEAGGRSALTPAAVIEWGTHARQRTVTAPLGEIAAAAAVAGIGAPALVVIGEVAALRDRLAWFDRLPLRGLRILVGRSRPQPSRVARALARLGAEVHEHPRLRSAPAPRPDRIDLAFQSLDVRDWVLFSSPAGVARFWAEAAERGLDVRCLGGARIAALGKATADALTRRGLLPEVRLRTFDMDTVAAALAEHLPLAGSSILFPREVHLESPVASFLRERGATVDEVEIFRTVVCDPLEVPQIDRDADLVVLPSSTAARAVAAVFGERTAGTLAVAIGPRTAVAATEAGFELAAVAEEQSVRGVVEAVLGIALRADVVGAPGWRAAQQLPSHP